MRLWSIHPSYLDPIGLVALWREGLLAKKVIQGKTKGYNHHPQLDRFRSQPRPVASMNSYLHSVWAEAHRRGYSFNKRKLGAYRKVRPIPVSSGQLDFELAHLLRKLKLRNKEHFHSVVKLKKAVPHPLFRVRKGPVEIWERR